MPAVNHAREGMMRSYLGRHEIDDLRQRHNINGHPHEIRQRNTSYLQLMESFRDAPPPHPTRLHGGGNHPGNEAYIPRRVSPEAHHEAFIPQRINHYAHHEAHMSRSVSHEACHKAHVPPRVSYDARHEAHMPRRVSHDAHHEAHMPRRVSQDVHHEAHVPRRVSHEACYPLADRQYNGHRRHPDCIPQRRSHEPCHQRVNLEALRDQRSRYSVNTKTSFASHWNDIREGDSKSLTSCYSPLNMIPKYTLLLTECANVITPENHRAVHQQKSDSQYCDLSLGLEFPNSGLEIPDVRPGLKFPPGSDRGPNHSSNHQLVQAHCKHQVPISSNQPSKRHKSNESETHGNDGDCREWTDTITSDNPKDRELAWEPRFGNQELMHAVSITIHSIKCDPYQMVHERFGSFGIECVRLSIGTHQAAGIIVFQAKQTQETVLANKNKFLPLISLSAARACEIDRAVCIEQIPKSLTCSMLGDQIASKLSITASMVKVLQPAPEHRLCYAVFENLAMKYKALSLNGAPMEGYTLSITPVYESNGILSSTDFSVPEDSKAGPSTHKKERM